MSMIERRRLLLSLARIKNFMIFDTDLRAGEVCGNSYSEIYSGSYIRVVGGRVKNDRTRELRFSYSVYTETEALDYVKNELYNGNLTGLSISITSRTSTGFTITVVNTLESEYRNVSGYITIGSYDFTKYKKLKFTVASYTAGGSVSVGSKSVEITAAGEYSVDINDLKGAFDIKFSSDGVNGYTVNNVYLEG
ncbi:MAG: hypothetical protein IJA06_03775 [Oscillospiraceae bacterium]|nr:hypothetical protein [Oscillospiraceae bacterium]MBQ3560919.1 hypothetical protein [Oscillospiraceae bacterium]